MYVNIGRQLEINDVVVEVVESTDIVVGSVTQAVGKVVDVSKKVVVLVGDAVEAATDAM
jgi:hypothetical protein